MLTPRTPTDAPKILPADPPTVQRAGAYGTRDHGPARSVAVLGAGRMIVVSGGRDARVAAIAAQQRNRVNRRQLLAANLTSDQVGHLIRADRLFPQLPGVYAVGSPARVHLRRETSALLAVREGALLSHVSAARLWGLVTDDGGGDEPVDVMVPGGWIPHVSGLHGHRSRILELAIDRRVRERLPICSPARVLLDLAGQITERELERAFDEARISGIVTAAEIDELVRRAGRHRGVPPLRELLAAADAGITESEAEWRLHDLLGQSDAPLPRRNAWVLGYRLDCYWPGAAFAAEADGFRFHSSRRRFESDRVRDARLAAAGIEVMRVTWRQMEREPLAVVARIAAAIARRTAIASR